MSLLAKLPLTFDHYAMVSTKEAGALKRSYPTVTNDNVPCHLFQSTEPVIDEYGQHKLKDNQIVIFTLPITVKADDQIVIESVNYRVIKSKAMRDGFGQVRFYRLDVTERS